MRRLLAAVMFLSLCGCDQDCQIMVWVRRGDSDEFMEKVVVRWVPDDMSKSLTEFGQFDMRRSAHVIRAPKEDGTVIIEYTGYEPDTMFVNGGDAKWECRLTKLNGT